MSRPHTESDHIPQTAYDELFGRKVRRVVGSRRAVVIGFPGFGGRHVALASAIALTRLLEPGPRRLTVIDATAQTEQWELDSKRLEPEVSVRVVSQTKVTNDPSLLGPGSVLLPVASHLTRTRTSAAWSSFAPALRNHPLVVMFCLYEEFTPRIHLCELVAPMDQVVVMHPKFHGEP